MSQPVGRRAAPSDDPDLGPAPTPSLAERPRRGIVDDAAPAVGPRRGIPADEPPVPARRCVAAYVLSGLALLIAVAIAVAYLVLGGRTVPAGPATAPPRPSVTPSAGAPTSPSPGGAPTSASPDPAASGPVTTQLLQINDATLAVYNGWSVQDDQEVQDKRRLVRLRQDATDARVQAVTLTAVDDSLDDACTALVADLTSSYTDVKDTAPDAVAVAADDQAVTCSFTGERTSDKVGNTVTFTVIRRAEDDHTLVFRATVPTALPSSSSTEDELEHMLCSSAASFDVEIERCSR